MFPLKWHFDYTCKSHIYLFLKHASKHHLQEICRNTKHETKTEFLF